MQRQALKHINCLFVELVFYEWIDVPNDDCWALHDVYHVQPVIIGSRLSYSYSNNIYTKVYYRVTLWYKIKGNCTTHFTVSLNWVWSVQKDILWITILQRPFHASSFSVKQLSRRGKLSHHREFVIASFTLTCDNSLPLRVSVS